MLHQVFHLTLIEEIYGCRDVMNLPGKSEVVANSISDDEINTSSDLYSDANKSNVLKQDPRHILAKGDDGKLKLIFQRDKSSPWIFNTGFCPLNV